MAKLVFKLVAPMDLLAVSLPAGAEVATLITPDGLDPLVALALMERRHALPALSDPIDATIAAPISTREDPAEVATGAVVAPPTAAPGK